MDILSRTFIESLALKISMVLIEYKFILCILHQTKGSSLGLHPIPPTKPIISDLTVQFKLKFIYDHEYDI